MSRALVLNASFEALGTVPARRAVVLLLAGKGDCVHATGLVLHAERVEVPVPSVLRLRTFVSVPYRRRVAVSRTAVMARDGHRCQYCGARGYGGGCGRWSRRGPRSTGSGGRRGP